MSGTMLRITLAGRDVGRLVFPQPGDVCPADRFDPYCTGAHR
jgi:hypothetical protein